MRLTQTEIGIIKKTVRARFGGAARVLLFGSRIDDSRRGGDIDLLVESDQTGAQAFNSRLNAISDMQLALGERKIDLVTALPAQEDERLIVRVARKTGIEL